MQAQKLPAQYEKCPKHTSNDIILFCLSGNCIEPLCKECCKLHVAWHNSQGTKAILDTVDNVRQNCVNDIHGLKVRFEEERAILKHFSDSDHSHLIVSVQHKLEKVKKTLIQMINDYCGSLEQQIKQKINQHRSAHPSEKKELHAKLNHVIADLDQQERALVQPRYMKDLLMVLMEEKNHDLTGFAKEIDDSVRHYLSNMFDVFVHEDKLQRVSEELHHYVEIHQANLVEEIEIYAQKLRSGKKVYGVDQLANFPAVQGGLSPCACSGNRALFERRLQGSYMRLKQPYYE